MPEFYGRSMSSFIKKKKPNSNDLFLELILTITETWGDLNYCGLTGIEVVDINDVECEIHSFEARPRDVTILPTNAHDARTLDK